MTSLTDYPRWQLPWQWGGGREHQDSCFGKWCCHSEHPTCHPFLPPQALPREVWESQDKRRHGRNVQVADRTKVEVVHPGHIVDAIQAFHLKGESGRQGPPSPLSALTTSALGCYGNTGRVLQATRFLGTGDGKCTRTQSSQPSVQLSSSGCGSFHKLLAVLCSPRVTLGQGGDILIMPCIHRIPLGSMSPRLSIVLMDPWGQCQSYGPSSFYQPSPVSTWGPFAQGAIPFTPLSTHKLFSGQNPGGLNRCQSQPHASDRTPPDGLFFPAACNVDLGQEQLLESNSRLTMSPSGHGAMQLASSRAGSLHSHSHDLYLPSPCTPWLPWFPYPCSSGQLVAFPISDQWAFIMSSLLLLYFASCGLEPISSIHP